MSFGGLVFLTSAVFSGRAAASAAQQIDLTFQAPPECPQAAEVLRQVDAELGNDFVTDTRLRVVASVVLADTHDYALDIHYTTQHGASDRRQVRSESCGMASSAAALFIAMALNPLVVTRATSPVPEPTKHEPASGPSLGVSAVLETAALPELAVGAHARAGWRFGAWRVSAGVLLTLPQSSTRGVVTSEFRLWSIDLGACYLMGGSALLVGPCARLEVGQLSGNAQGVAGGTRAGSARMQAAHLEAEGRMRVIPKLWLRLSAGFEWIERRPQFTISGLGTVASPTPFGARFAFGPMFEW